MLLTGTIEQKVTYEKQYVVFRKLLAVSDIMEYIDGIVVNEGGKIQINWI